MNTDFNIRPIQNDDVIPVSEMVRKSLAAYVFPDCDDEGRGILTKFTEPSAFKQRLELGNLGLVLMKDGEIAAYLEMDKMHIRLMFTHQKHLRKGYSKALLKKGLEHIKQGRITVHSSPYAETIYEKMGFKATGPHQKQNGIAFIPMALELPSE